MPKRGRARPLSGAQKIKASGRKVIMLTLDPADMDLIRQAALIEGRKPTQFVRFYATRAAADVTLQRRIMG